MVDFDRDDDPVESPGTPWLALILVGLVALAPGVAALVLAFQTDGEITSLREGVTDLQAGLDGSGDEIGGRITEVSSQFEGVSRRIDALARDVSALKRDTRDLPGQTQRALNEIAREITSTRRQQDALARQLQELAERQNELAEIRVAPVPTPVMNPVVTSEPEPEPRPRQRPTASPAPEPTPVAIQITETYSIQPGDTYGQLARRFGVSVDDFFDVNPGVDPRRLRVGQEINLPPGANEE